MFLGIKHIKTIKSPIALVLFTAHCGVGIKSIESQATAQAITVAPVKYEFHVEDYVQPNDVDYGPAFARALADPAGCSAPSNRSPLAYTQGGCLIRLACNVTYNVSSQHIRIPEFGDVRITGCGYSSQITAYNSREPLILQNRFGRLDLSDLIVLARRPATVTSTAPAIEVRGWFGGHRIRVRGATGDDILINGNTGLGYITDNWYIDSSVIDLSDNAGIRIIGGDGNLGVSIGNNIGSNCQNPTTGLTCSGVVDNGFLGNTYVATLTASNGPAGNVQPGFTFSDQAGQRSAGLGNYQEGDGAPSHLGNSTLFLGGLMASNVPGVFTAGPGNYISGTGIGSGLISGGFSFKGNKLWSYFDGATNTGGQRLTAPGQAHSWVRDFSGTTGYLKSWYEDSFNGAPSFIGQALAGDGALLPNGTPAQLGSNWLAPTAPLLVGAAAVRVGTGATPPVPSSAWPAGSLWIYSSPSIGGPSQARMVCVLGVCAWHTTETVQ